MSLEEIRRKNKANTAEKALEHFIEYGIDGANMKQIAQDAGVTERSLYRYYADKRELVLAASRILWDRLTGRAIARISTPRIQKMKGIEQLRTMLYYYGALIFESEKTIRFILDAELYLNRTQCTELQQGERKLFASSPLTVAIHRGLQDGSIRPDTNPDFFYFLAYDSILGTMQRISLGTSGLSASANRKRLRKLIDLLVDEIAA